MATNNKDIRQRVNYWHWFFRGSGGRPGYRRLLNKWLSLHFAIGLALWWFVPVPLKQAATAVLIPLSGVFVGVAFAWAVTAHSLIQSREIQRLAEHKEGGLSDYVFTYQAAVFVAFVTVILWGLAGLEAFDLRWPTPNRPYVYLLVKTSLFALASLTFRECWHVVLGTHVLLLIQQEAKRHISSAKERRPDCSTGLTGPDGRDHETLDS